MDAKIVEMKEKRKTLLTEKTHCKENIFARNKNKTLESYYDLDAILFIRRRHIETNIF